ncbi:ATP synthase F0 subunit B [Marinilabiliaceae bacterium JC017]|nr:ATP synthase F0 subunit B [Marinilabiliaceae bacterium JC017]
MELLTPDPGLVFWSGLTFLILVFILRRYAWKPILHAIKVREETIEFALEAAENAQKQTALLEKNREQMMIEAKRERNKLLKEARRIKKEIISDAHNAAQLESEKIMESARKEIEKEKEEAVHELRKQLALMSVDIAGKLLEEELKPTSRQMQLIDRYLDEVNFS